MRPEKGTLAGELSISRQTLCQHLSTDATSWEVNDAS
jgi:hypothetical protein